MPSEISPENLSTEGGLETPAFAEPENPPEPNNFIDDEIDPLNVELKLSEEEEKEIVLYLQDNLPKMKGSKEDDDRIHAYLAMYEATVQKRNFPYENAPSIASSDAADKMNEWLDQAETAFLQQNTTFSVDREESNLNETNTRRIEKTFHREFFIKSGFRKDLRLMLFEAGYLGGCIVAPKECYDIRPVREKLIIKSEKDLQDNAASMSVQQMNDAKDKIVDGKIYISDNDVLKVVHVGPKVSRVDQTKFWFPRNAKESKSWQVVAEQEFYTRSALEEMASRGLVDGAAVDKAIEKRRELYRMYQDAKKGKRSGMLEEVKPDELDSDWAAEMDGVKEYGDSYDDELATYRVTMLYHAKTKQDPEGKLRSWIQVIYCPAGENILAASFCVDGEFPYRVLQYRPVPYKAIGPGIAQQRFNHNMMTNDIMSYFLSSLEQELGAPLMIRENSNLFATGFRAYPGAVCYTMNPQQDAAFLQFPNKSQLAVEGIKMILGTSPMANKGADYASGKREELIMQEKMMAIKSRVYSIALDLDDTINMVWKMYCRMSKLNRINKKYVNWVYDEIPENKKLYVLQQEMRPDVSWSCAVSALSLTPDARLQKAMMMKDILYDKVPVSVNSPRLTIEWLSFIADHFDELNQDTKNKLLPQDQDFAMYQQQLGAQGGERPNEGQPPQQKEQRPSTPAVAQSQKTPFRNPKSE